MLSVLIPNRLEENARAFADVVAAALPASQVIVAVDREGKGKGWALREALAEAKGDVIAFLDADGDIKPRMLRRLIPFLDDYDVVVASKNLSSARLHRKIITHLSRLHVRLVFGLGVDTQTGLKLFRRAALPDWKTNGYGFDIEILLKAKRSGVKIIEVPIEVSISAGMSLKTLWNTFIETLIIRFFR